MNTKAAPTTHTIQVCKVVEENNDGVNQGGNFSGEIRQWIGTTTFTAVPWAVTGVLEGGDPACTTVTTVPSDRTFNVTEFGFRPAGWVSDASGYPWYKDNQNITHSANVTTVNYTADVIVTFHNKSTPATRDVTVCKVVIANGDSVVRGAFSWGFDVRPVGQSPVQQGSNSVAEPAGAAGTESAEVCKVVKVATNIDIEVVEWSSRPASPAWVDETGYPQYSINDGSRVSNNTTSVIAKGTSAVKVTFFNRETPLDKEIVIDKLFIGAFTADDYPTFTLNPVPTGFVFADDCTPAISGQKVTWTCTVPYSWTGSITETPKPGWQQLGDVACRTLFSQLDTPVSAFFFCNQAVGRVVIVKYDGVDPGTLQSWTFTGTLTGAPFIIETHATANAPAGTVRFVNDVPTGNYSLSETEGRAVCTTGTTSSDWQTHGLVSSALPSASDLNAAPVIGNGALNFAVAKGETTYVAFGNRGCGTVQLQVIKFNDPAANFTGNAPLSDWEITITGTAGAATGFVASENTNGAAGALFLLIPDGTYTVCETPKVNWVVVGSRHNAVNQAGSCRAGVVINLNETVVVNFYNQPRVNIVVSKTIYNNANPEGGNGGSGWTFTLSGCGIGPLQQTTGASGSVSWTDLPPAVGCSYTVTETAKAGWVADQISKTASPTQAGSTANLTFINRQFEGCTNIADCPPTTSTPTPTPTATPVTPTNTPNPQATPTNTPDPEATPTDTPDSAIGGEGTGGQATPVAPSTGAGFGGNSTAEMNILFLIAGLIAIGGGLSFIALGRRPTSR